ncbi:thiopeptide-type bacteriocin biosynthesis protein [Chryseobacterium phocaeense]|uniref:thiopeptide-type bacteriocin biosynthesis protein n=1 Tax=Chryseobacterium phocaeense TaxID=1816690 RepID=UPI0009BB6825|nr:thiopeptide-type bacteriocin biosynthesis protein [Chryseobacterium phocaeense]
MEKIWKTYYLFHENHADPVLTGVVHPLIQNIEKKLEREVKFFFIRYFEGGYHIRLRLLLNAEECIIFLSLLKEQISVYEELSKSSLVLKEAQYIPETDRYGNTETITYAEDQFYASSRFILHHLVENSPLSASERYLFALKTHLAFFKGMELSQNHILQLCDQFVQSWLPVPFSENPDEQEQNRKDVLDAFQNQFNAYQTLLAENLTEFWNSTEMSEDFYLQQFLTSNRNVFANYSQSRLPPEALDEALLSCIHMANNRLGIVNAEESYILFLIMRIIPLIKNYGDKS